MAVKIQFSRFGGFWGRGGLQLLKNLEDGRIENLIFKAWWDLGKEGKKAITKFGGGKS